MIAGIIAHFTRQTGAAPPMRGGEPSMGGACSCGCATSPIDDVFAMSRRQRGLHARDCESGVVSDGFAEPGWNDPANLSRKRKSFAVEDGVYDRHE